MRIRILFAALGLAGLVSLAAAQEPAKTQPPANVVPSTFRMFLVTDPRFPPVKNDAGKEEASPKNRAGKMHCLVSEYGLNPVVAVFVRADPEKLAADSGVARLVKGLDGIVPKYRGDKLSGFVAFLLLKGGTKVVTIKAVKNGVETEEKVEQDLEYPDDDARDKSATEVRNFAERVMSPNIPFGLAPEKSKAVAAWRVKATDEVTVVFYNKMRVVGEPWRFAKVADLTDENVAEILKSAEAAITSRK